MLNYDQYKVTITQLLPADGWYAVYAEGDEEATVTLRYQPLISWALVAMVESDSQPSQQVTGLSFEGADTRNYFCENRGNFLGYTKKDDPYALTHDEWMEEALDHLSRNYAHHQTKTRERQKDDQMRRSMQGDEKRTQP